MWLCAFLLASPLAVFSTVTSSYAKLTCSEVSDRTAIRAAKLIYSLVNMFLQYILPLTLVSLAYTHICLRIQNRMQILSSTNSGNTAVMTSVAKVPNILTKLAEPWSELASRSEMSVHGETSGHKDLRVNEPSWLSKNTENRGSEEISRNKASHQQSQRTKDVGVKPEVNIGLEGNKELYFNAVNAAELESKVSSSLTMLAEAKCEAVEQDPSRFAYLPLNLAMPGIWAQIKANEPCHNQTSIETQFHSKHRKHNQKPPRSEKESFFEPVPNEIGQLLRVQAQLPTFASLSRRRLRTPAEVTKQRRKWRTSLLLAAIAIIFALSWLPLNIINVFLDIRELRFRPRELLNCSRQLHPGGEISDCRSTLLFSLPRRQSSGRRSVLGSLGRRRLGQTEQSLLKREGQKDDVGQLIRLARHLQIAETDESMDAVLTEGLLHDDVVEEVSTSKIVRASREEGLTAEKNPTESIIDIRLPVSVYHGEFATRSREAKRRMLSGANVLTIQAFCLLFVLVSACVNPLIYGWLNENFRKSFQKLLCCQSPDAGLRERSVAPTNAKGR
ncbi:unnamed protein product [Protopolystoma xenopodis]|uniref:G-protein coupled receptors family 1 profile domain-containing protein n=1 Tax=Protopolystoma xenopodis TaxID=117903 RepID=A0A3S5A6M3_9PLAT|nr:unnamed protein product [Protopolystoma xenopodis]